VSELTAVTLAGVNAASQLASGREGFFEVLLALGGRF
jgi:hypothetical protein